MSGETDGAASPFDEEFLLRQAAGDRALMREVAQLFRDQLKAQMAVITGGGEAMLRYEAAHTLKGASLSIGARPLAEAARKMEAGLRRLAEGGETAGLDELLAPLEAAAAACDAALAAFLARA